MDLRYSPEVCDIRTWARNAPCCAEASSNRPLNLCWLRLVLLALDDAWLMASLHATGTDDKTLLLKRNGHAISTVG
jgi:hypothetical protein